MMNAKKYLAGTKLGQAALSYRSRRDLLWHARRQSEQTVTKINDITSRRLRDALCDDGAVFVDVGAHIGSVLGGVMRNSRPGKIIAIEAIPEKAQHLRRSFRAVEIHECAAGETEGEVEFTIDMAASGYSSLDPGIRSRTSSFEIIAVTMKRLDDILPHRNVSVMKIDIEGAELGALKGAEAVVAGSRPAIVFESGVHEMEGYPKPALFAWLAKHDYGVFAPIRVAHSAPPMTLEVFLDAHEYPRMSTDFFAIPHERVAQIRDKARAILGVG